MVDVNRQVLADIKKSFIIPSKPALLVSLRQQLNADDPNIAKVADVINGDIGIAGAVLKVVNSPAYGMARTITDIKQSVMLIGLDGVNSLVTGLIIKQAYSQHKSSISLDNFWDKASNVARVAMFIGKRFKSRVALEDIYTAALFQDCGIPAMAIKYTDYGEIIDLANKDIDRTAIEIEESRYPTNHAVVGYFIATTWHLPTKICQLVLRHHEREYLNLAKDEDELLLFSVIKMAENIVNNLDRFHELPDWPAIKDHVFELVGCDEDEYHDTYEEVERMLTHRHC